MFMVNMERSNLLDEDAICGVNKTWDMKKEVVEKTLNLLCDNPEWEDRYAGYANYILEKYPRGFKKPQGLSIYSSVSMYKGHTYDLRFDGQSVGKIYDQLFPKKVTLELNEDANRKYFGLELKNRRIDWNADPDAKIFRRFFRDKAKENDVNLKSPEHRVENRLLKEFAKKTRAENKALTNIQPITLNGCFFQMPTPIKASKHHPEYAKQFGGGIDIMARSGRKICVMEVKDENKESESQAAATEQALTYATFIARLLRSKSGKRWWNFFMDRETDLTPVRKELEIDVVTIMPKGDTEEFLGDIDLPELATTFHCHTLYYDDDQFKKGEFEFSGSFCKK